MDNLSLVDCVSRVNNIFVKFVESNLIRLQKSSLKFTHYDIIKLLFIHDKLTLKDVSSLICRHKSTVTVLIKKLVQEDYVELISCSSDKRVTFVSLTVKGKRFKSVINSIDQQFIIFINKVYSIQDQRHIKQLLLKVINPNI